MNANPVVHFEFPADDVDRMSDFYNKTFGWEIQKLGPEYGGYVTVMTTESDANGPKAPGAINGGFYQRGEENNVPTVVIAVEDIRESMKKVEEAGGKITGGQVIGEPDNIPGVGLYVAFSDTEGNRVAMLQPVGGVNTQPKSE